jgi:hypothetical protein
MFLKGVLKAFGSAATAVGHFFAGAFKWVETDGAKIALAIIEEVKIITSNPSTGFIASILDELTKSNIPTEILAELKAKLPDALAVSLAIQGLPSDPTEQDIEDLEKRILDAFGVAPDKSEFYSRLGAKIISIIRANTMPGQKFTFATLVNDLEQAYQAYLIAKQGDAVAA